MAAALVSLPADVIVASGSDAALAARDATSTIPIVAAGIADPFAIGLVSNLAHPGGNITGTSLTGLPAKKTLELLGSVIPGLSRLAILSNPASARTPPALLGLEQAATTLGMQTMRVAVRSADEFEPAFAQMQAWRAGALFVMSESSLISPHYGLIADLALHSFVDRILRGASPGDLPIQQASVFEFVINLKTARALGISFPPDVAAQVTDWIE